MGRRGPTGADALLGVVEDVQRSAGARYVDAPTTVRTAELLAHRKDRRVVPLLEAMLHSQSRVIGTKPGAGGARTTEGFGSVVRADPGLASGVPASEP